MNKLEINEVVENSYLILLVIVIFSIFYYIPDFITEPKKINLILFSPFLFLIFPFLFYKFYFQKSKEKKLIEIPRLLKEVNDRYLTGTDLISSFLQINPNSYKYITIDLKKLLNSLGWGMNFEDSFRNFSKNIGDKEFIQDIEIALKTKRIGGNIEIIFKELAEKIETDNKNSIERKAGLYSSVFTSYMSFIIFLGIMIQMYNALFLDVFSQESFKNNTSKEELDFILSLFMLLTYELSILSGFIFGFMENTKLITGTKHIFILTTITFFAFLLFI
jgi:hypothetical protein